MAVTPIPALDDCLDQDFKVAFGPRLYKPLTEFLECVREVINTSAASGDEHVSNITFDSNTRELTIEYAEMLPTVVVTLPNDSITPVFAPATAVAASDPLDPTIAEIEAWAAATTNTNVMVCYTGTDSMSDPAIRIYYVDPFGNAKLVSIEAKDDERLTIFWLPDDVVDQSWRPQSSGVITDISLYVTQVPSSASGSVLLEVVKNGTVNLLTGVYDAETASVGSNPLPLAPEADREFQPGDVITATLTSDNDDMAADTIEVDLGFRRL